MNKNRLIFYAVFAIFHIFLLVFSIYVDTQKEDFAFLSKLLSWISITKYGAMFGLILLAVDVAWSFTLNKKTEFEKNSLTNELTTLKAKLFDLQEAAKKVGETTPTKDKQP